MPPLLIVGAWLMSVSSAAALENVIGRISTKHTYHQALRCREAAARQTVNNTMACRDCTLLVSAETRAEMPFAFCHTHKPH